MDKKQANLLDGVCEEYSINPIAIWFMRQAGRYLPEYRDLRSRSRGFLDLCYTPELSSKVTLQPIERFDLDLAILFSDILVIPDALGQKVRFVDGEGPKLDSFIKFREGYELNEEQYLKNLKPVYEAVKLIKIKLRNTKPLIGFSGAPWTLATYMVEEASSRNFSKIFKLMESDLTSFEELMDILKKAVVSHLISQAKAGADILQIFDSWAGALPDQEIEKWVIEPTASIVDQVRSLYPSIPIIGFPKGIGLNYVNYVKRTKVDGISLDSSVSVKWAAENIPANCTIQGNLDPNLLVAGGKEMINAAEEIVIGLRERSHIFNLGHGITPSTPTENVTVLVNEVRNLGQRYR